MYIRCYKGVNVMAVVRDFYLENGCHFKINDAELLPEEERIEVIHRLERIVVQDRMNRLAKKWAAEDAKRQAEETQKKE